jgi:hypothetical protein
VAQTTRHRIIYASLFIAAIIMGCASGLYVYKNTGLLKHILKAEPSARDSFSAENKKPIVVNDHIYNVSYPSVGTLIKTKDIKFDTIKGGMGTLSLMDDDVGIITTGDYVVLHDKNDEILPAIGEVTSVGKGFMDKAKNQTNLTVAFSALDANTIQEISSGKIFGIDEKADAPRLPASSIFKDEDGQEFVWEVRENDGAKSAIKTPANIIYRTQDYVVITPTFGTSNIYILNPDDKLTDGILIQFEKTPYAPPEKTQAQVIAEKIYKDIEDVAKTGVHNYVYTRPGGQSADPAAASTQPGGGGCAADPNTGPSCSANNRPATGSIQLPMP